MTAMVKLQEGTEFVAVANIPALIAEALNPIETCERCADPAYTPDMYTPIWPGNEERTIYDTDTPEAKKLEAEFQSYLIKRKHSQHLYLIEREHLQHLMAAIKRGEITPISRTTRVPVDERQPDSILMVDAFTKYVQRFGIGVSFEQAADEAAPANVPSAAKVEAEPLSQPGEPPMRQGKNNREAMAAWVDWQARDLVKDGQRVSDLANEIYLKAERWGYQSERQKDGENIKAANIIKMIPAGLTGGRAKNTGKTKK